MSTMASQITSVSIVYSTVCSGADQRKHQSSASLAFVRGIHRSSANSPHTGTVTRTMFPFDDVIMSAKYDQCSIALLYSMHCFVQYRVLLARVLTAFDFIIVQGHRGVQYCFQNYGQIPTSLRHSFIYILDYIVDFQVSDGIITCYVCRLCQLMAL